MAVPFESEVACVGNTEPSPEAGPNVIVDSATGFPCVSVTRTTRGTSSGVPTTPDCWSPETFTSSTGGPVSAVAVRTTGTSPGTSTVTSCVPGVVPRIQPPTVATPITSVRTVRLGETSLPSINSRRPPFADTEKSTSNEETGAPPGPRTCTDGGSGSRSPTIPVCPSPPRICTSWGTVVARAETVVGRSGSTMMETLWSPRGPPRVH